MNTYIVHAQQSDSMPKIEQKRRESTLLRYSLNQMQY